MYDPDLSGFVVGIKQPDISGSWLGTGFLIGHQDNLHVVTCFHVVGTRKTGSLRQTILEVYFPATQVTRDAKVLQDACDPIRDVAMLRLLEPPPHGVHLLRPSLFSFSGCRFVSLGFRKAKHGYRGLRAGGTIRGLIEAPESEGGPEEQLLQLYSDEVEKGMSGAPVVVPDLMRVVGIVAIGNKTRWNTDTNLAFARPMQAVWDVWPGLREQYPRLPQDREECELFNKHIRIRALHTQTATRDDRLASAYEQAAATREALLQEWKRPALLVSPKTLSDSWATDTGASIRGTPVLNEKHLYIATVSGQILALSRSSGMVDWDQSIPANVTSDLSLVGDRLLVPGRDGNLYILETETGAVAASVTIGGALKAACLVINDKAYVVSDIRTGCLRSGEGRFAVVDPESARVLRRTTISSSGLRARPARLGNLLFVADRHMSGGTVYSIERDRISRVKSIFRARHGITAPLCADERRQLLYVVDLGGFVYALDPSGDLRWEFRTGAQIVAAPLSTQQLLYVASGDGVLYALDADAPSDTQRNVWRFSAGSFIASSPLLWRGLIYVVNNAGVIYAIGSNGNLEWDYSLGDTVFTSPVSDGEGTLYVTNGDGRVVALPWHCGHFDSAASKVEDMELWDEAARLWIKANLPVQAQRAFREARNYVCSAFIAQQMGWIEDAARDYEKAAQAHRYDCPSEAAALFSEAAYIFGRLSNSEEAVQRCLHLAAKTARGPLLRIQAGKPSTKDDRVQWTYWVSNEGFAPAYAVAAYLGSNGYTLDEEQLGVMREGESRRLDVLLQLDDTLPTSLAVTLVYADPGGRVQLPVHFESAL